MGPATALHPLAPRANPLGGGEPAPVLIARLRETAELIETMLRAERQRYFDSLWLKSRSGISTNVTAAFFADER